MQSERFCLLTRQNGTKFCRDQKDEFKKTFQTLPPNLIKGPYKSWLTFCPFCMDEKERNEANSSFILKKPFFYHGSKFNEYFVKFWTHN